MSLQHASDNSKKAMLAKKINESTLHSNQELEALFDEFDASNGKAPPKQEQTAEEETVRTTLPIFDAEPEIESKSELEPQRSPVTFTEEDVVQLGEEVLINLSEEDLEHIYNSELNLLSEYAIQLLSKAISEPKLESSEEEEILDEEDFSATHEEEIREDEDNLSETYEEETSEDESYEKNLFPTNNAKEENKKDVEQEIMYDPIRSEPVKSKRDSSDRESNEIDEEKIKGFFKNLFKKKSKDSKEDSKNKEKKGFFKKKDKSEKEDKSEKKKEKKGFLKKKINRDNDESSFNKKKIIIIVVSAILITTLALFFISKLDSYKSTKDLAKEGLIIEGTELSIVIPAPEDEESYTGSIVVYLVLEEKEEGEISCESDIVDVVEGGEISTIMYCNKDLNEEKKYKVKTLESNYF